jgi:hypothetical protein
MGGGKERTLDFALGESTNHLLKFRGIKLWKNKRHQPVMFCFRVRDLRRRTEIFNWSR